MTGSRLPPLLWDVDAQIRVVQGIACDDIFIIPTYSHDQQFVILSLLLYRLSLLPTS
jgi:hypothetical protein